MMASVDSSVSTVTKFFLTLLRVRRERESRSYLAAATLSITLPEEM